MKLKRNVRRTIESVSGVRPVEGVKICAPVCFFQAEDGIRDLTVTGVQRWALPIWAGRRPADRKQRCRQGALRGFLVDKRLRLPAGLSRLEVESRRTHERVPAGAWDDRSQGREGEDRKSVG